MKKLIILAFIALTSCSEDFRSPRAFQLMTGETVEFYIPIDINMHVGDTVFIRKSNLHNNGWYITNDTSDTKAVIK